MEENFSDFTQTPNITVSAPYAARFPEALAFGLFTAVAMAFVVVEKWIPVIAIFLVLIIYGAFRLRSPFFTNAIPRTSWKQTLLPALVPCLFIFVIPLLRELSVPLAVTVAAVVTAIAATLAVWQFPPRSPRAEYPPLPAKTPGDDQLATAHSYRGLLNTLHTLGAVEPLRIRLWGIQRTTGWQVSDLAEAAKNLAQARLISLHTLDAGEKKSHWLVALSAHGLGALGTLHNYDAEHKTDSA